MLAASHSEPKIRFSVIFEAVDCEDFEVIAGGGVIDSKESANAEIFVGIERFAGRFFLENFDFCFLMGTGARANVGWAGWAS